MARKIERLSALQVNKLNSAGYHADGAGLWLQITRSGAKSWIFRYMLNGKAREMGLGPTHTVGLAGARARAADARRLLLQGIDPIEARRAQKATQSLNGSKNIPFDRCAKEYIKAHQAGWKNAKHANQWSNTLSTYAFPLIGKLPVGEIDTGLVMRVLEPLWNEKTETASRLRARIENILSWATVRGYRSGDNPARWRGHLDKLLPKRSKVAAVQHHPALPYSQIKGFMEKLHAQHGVSAQALEFLILTASRTGEVLLAKWDEIDLKAKLWIIPATRMKANREHRIPLSKPAMRIIETMETIKSSDYIFPGGRTDQPLSNNTLLMLLRRMGRSDITAHGFRSTFRDWAAERTSYPREVAEM